MKKINCPICGKELIVLNDITTGTYYKYYYDANNTKRVMDILNQ